MILNFKHVDIKNFFSIGEASVDLSDQGLVQVKGVNKAPGSSDSNGAGKSSIFEAVYYALTGDTLRGTKEVANRFASSKTVDITLDFEMDGISYRIERTRNHPKHGNNLKIWKNDVDISGDKLKKSEAILAQELGLVDSSLINGIIILGQSMPNRFTSLTPIQRKDRLEVLSQSSEFIGELDVRLKNFQKFYDGKRNQCNIDIGAKSKEIEMFRESVVKLSNEIVLLSGKDVDINNSREEISRLNQEIEGFSSERNEYQIQMKTLETEIADFSAGASSDIQGQIDALEKEVSLLSDEDSLTVPQYVEIRNLDQEIVSFKNGSSSVQSEIDSLSFEIQGLEKTLVTYRNGYATLNQRYQDMVKVMAGHNSNISAINKYVEHLKDSMKAIYDVCPTCGRPMDAAEVEKARNEIQVKIDAEISKIPAIENLVKETQGNIDTIQARLRKGDSMISDCQSQISLKNNSVAQLKAKIQSEISKRETRIYQLKSEIDSMISFKKSQIAQLKAQIQSEISKREAQIAQLKAQIQSEISKREARIAQLKVEIDSIQEKIDKANEELSTVNDNISRCTVELGNLQQELKQYELKLNIMDFLKKKSSKEFRGYLLKGVVNYVNGKLTEYSKSLFGAGEITMSMDATCSKILISYDGSQYENLSGGERQRVDISVQFALRDMLMSSLGFSCNLLVLDEVFDGLDRSGISDLIEVINGLRTINSVFAISHHNITLPFDKELIVEKGLDKTSKVLVA